MWWRGQGTAPDRSEEGTRGPRIGGCASRGRKRRHLAHVDEYRTFTDVVVCGAPITPHSTHTRQCTPNKNIATLMHLGGQSDVMIN